MKHDTTFQQGEQMSLFSKKGYLHGGARPGAGRPKTSRKEQHGIRCTPEEWRAVQELLATMRRKEEMENRDGEERKSGMEHSRTSRKH